MIHKNLLSIIGLIFIISTNTSMLKTTLYSENSCFNTMKSILEQVESVNLQYLQMNLSSLQEEISYIIDNGKLLLKECTSSCKEIITMRENVDKTINLIEKKNFKELMSLLPKVISELQFALIKCDKLMQI